MHCEEFVKDTCVDREEQQEIQSPQCDEQRQYHREYMRRWRADPSHKERERDKRQQSYCGRKLRNAERDKGARTSDPGEPVCNFCRLRPPLQTVVRLQICESAPGGYVRIRIPYCGQC